MNDYLFQYCQKIVLFSADHSTVLLAQRKGEADFDNYYSLIGGKLETTDASLVAGIKREKDEEVGEDLRIKVCSAYSCFNVLYKKNSGQSMVLPHYVAVHVEGEVRLNTEEYARYEWVPIKQIEAFGPKVDNIAQVVHQALRLLSLLRDEDFVEV